MAARGRAIGGLTLSALAAALACGRSDRSPVAQACVQQGPAFRLHVEAPQGPLPRDTSVRVIYQGNLSERFSLLRPRDNVDVCCAASATRLSGFEATPCDRDASASVVTHPLAIQCDVWSNGAAHVEISASGYATTQHDLEAQVDEQCETILTSEVTLVLQRSDAGAP